MKTAALVSTLAALCAAGSLQAQNTYGDWTAGKTGAGFDAITTISTGPSRAALDVLCQENGVGVRLQFGKAFGTPSSSGVQVRFQFDDTQGQTPARWALTYSGANSTAQLAQARVRQFVTKAKPSTTLNMRVVDPLNDEPVDFVFSMKGFAEALAALPCARGW